MELLSVEPDGQPTPGADGDARDDGVEFPAIIPGQPFELEVNVYNSFAPVDGGWLNAWIDLDQNGDWLGLGERFLSQHLSWGIHPLPVTLPEDAALGTTYVRFRLGGDADLGPGGICGEGEVEDYRVVIVNEHLGSIWFDELGGLDLSSGDKWYRLSPSQAGILSFEAAYSAAGGNVAMTLYDWKGNELANSSTGSGLERIDHSAYSVYVPYYLQVAGSNADVDLRLVNLVSVGGVGGDEVTIFGTDGDDVFVCTPSDTSFDFSINGLEYSVTPPDSGPLYITTKLGEGNDSFTFQGNDGNDTVRTSSTGAEVEGKIGTGVYFLQVESAEDITANGGGGDDVVVLRDSDGEDEFHAGPGWAEMSGTGFSQEVNNFSTIIGIASDDGQRDVAELEGQPGSPDQSRLAPSDSKVTGDGFFVRAKLFDEVYINATDASDVATLYPDGHDSVEMRADPPSATIAADGGQTAQALGFSTVIAFSEEGNDDVVYLYGSLTGEDTFLGKHLYGRLKGTSPGPPDHFFFRVKNFNTVRAYSNGGGSDVAVLRDGPGADTYEADPSRGALNYEDGSTVEANDFSQVHGFATNDGTDTATLFGLAGSSDRFRSRPTDARMSGNDFYNRAKFFERVVANASDSTDKAVLYDSPGDDAFEAYSDRGTMTHEDGTVVEANDFSQVHAFAIYGGNDTAILRDTTADLATSYPTWLKGGYGESKLYNGPAGFFNRAKGFEELHAALRGGDDRVRLYDDPSRVDHLVVPFLGDVDHDPCKAKLHNVQRAIYVDDFLTLYAYTSQNFVDDEDVDPAYEDQVICDGNWAEAP